MTHHFFVGLDLGQSQDYSALAIIEEPCWIREPYRFRLSQPEDGWAWPSNMRPEDAEEALRIDLREGKPPDPPLHLRHLQRYPLGTPYPEIIDDVRRLLWSDLLAYKRTAFLVDRTGVGAGVFDSFVHAGLDPKGVSIHGGDSVSRDGNVYRVPKRDLVSAVQVLLQNDRLKIAESLPLAETLKAELLNFKVKIDTKTGHDSYSHWREGDHDDLVLASAMACWYRLWYAYHLDNRNAGLVPAM
jgi:hypothetical protein